MSEEIQKLEAELVQLGADLQKKQRIFADSYLADPDLNATAAYRVAYPTAKGKSAETSASRMLSNAKVAAYTKLALEIRSKRTQIDASWLLRRLASEAEADLADIYYESGALRPIHEWPKIWRQGLVTGVDVEKLFDYVDGEREQVGHVVKVKLSDRVKRLEMLGKHVDVQAFKERIEQTNKNININATIDESTDSKTASQIYQDLIKAT